MASLKRLYMAVVVHPIAGVVAVGRDSETMTQRVDEFAAVHGWSNVQCMKVYARNYWQAARTVAEDRMVQISAEVQDTARVLGQLRSII